ncbi:Regulatory protein RecX [bioreactor metagenome]|uniref:Regulatory protein RecX n=1 Tax=bioreactor metagenome TaxID=1076179 RepID=A0A644W9Q4_9ZZZZ
MKAESDETVQSFRKQAIDQVLRSPVSKGQLIKQLARKAGNVTLAEETADWLEGLGLLDDVQYARDVARHYAAKGYGVFKVKEELYRRQIPRGLWDEALTALPDPAPAVDALLNVRLAAGERDPKLIKKAADALARRGFCWEDIQAGINQLSQGPEDEPN